MLTKERVLSNAAKVGLRDVAERLFARGASAGAVEQAVWDKAVAERGGKVSARTVDGFSDEEFVRGICSPIVITMDGDEGQEVDGRTRNIQDIDDEVLARSLEHCTFRLF